MAEFSRQAKELIAKYESWQKEQVKKPINTIHVDEVASKVAAFYEHIRTIVDWKEEHLMRRAAIIRKLKRRFLDLELNNFSDTNIAESLVLELIRGGYFPNNKIEEAKIKDIQDIINKYVFILKNSPENKKGKTGLQFYNWFLEIAACEIEENLDGFSKEMALIEFMFESMKERINVQESVYRSKIIKKEEVDIQIYIAVQQALFKLDNPIISYNLIKYKYPLWKNPSPEDLLKFSQNIYKIWRNIENDLTCSIGKKFYAICEKYDTAYLLIGDILAKDDLKNTIKEIENPAALELKIREAYKKRLILLRSKIIRAAFYSTVSIFLTKILTLLILETILARIITGHINVFNLILDVLIPTVLMFGLISMIKPPPKNNINLAVMEVMKIFYQQETKDTYEIKLARRRGTITSAILSLTYVVGAFISFGFIFGLFSLFDFPISSIIINTIFIALILFAGTAIQKRSQELTIEDESTGFLIFVSDVLFLPLAGMGKFLSNKWKKYNAIATFFNALIDMPFSVFVEFLERWRYFIKEKKEEIR